MIQRIQTLYLLFVAVLGVVGAVAFPAATLPTCIAGGLLALAALLALVAIFFFNKRRLQMRLCVFGIIAEGAALLVYICSVAGLCGDLSSPLSMLQCCLLAIPVVCSVLHFLAWRGIRADERLIRSIDRIR